MAARRVKENTGEGRISELPDSILHHIFTLVPTIDGVRMSILSKRWRRVRFSIIPALNFSEMRIHFLARKLYIDTSITRFSLQIRDETSSTYCVPDVVLNAQSLTLLKLENLKMAGPLRDLIFPHYMRSICRSSVLALDHMNVRTFRPLSESSGLKDALYWLSPILCSHYLQNRIREVSMFSSHN
ncbi:hypothetical protein TIFTF001_004040 [Ficus carica]|uniref:F-box domain-containing protein n=1 Tax=Ficus carica TaxID=3494 RepID=A0AA87ZEE8_FICCA|nr:hypothetical protein TIFTF001_004040 [Ficus carica]